jgi:alpha-beta hydrolase superfamily lysophospholipase
MTTMTRDITFTSDGLRLQGVLHLPGGVARPPVVVGSHGLLATADSAKQIALARECNRIGIAFLRFDHRGCGRSEGDFRAVTTLEGRCADLLAAVEAVLARSDVGSRLGLFGSSMGGATCLAAAHRLNVGPLVVVAAPVRSRALDASAEAHRDPASGSLAYDPDKLRFDIGDRLDSVRHILVVHGEADDIVPLSHGLEIHRKARPPKRLLVLPAGDHTISDPAHQERFVREAVDWFAGGLGVPG